MNANQGSEWNLKENREKRMYLNSIISHVKQVVFLYITILNVGKGSIISIKFL